MSGVTFQKPFHVKIRWFVVIREGPSYCSCLPINTYGEQGVAKSHVVKGEHSVIYSGPKPPRILRSEHARYGESGMLSPLRVQPRQRGDRLNDLSRINYGKIYTVEHNVKVYEFGDVHKGSLKRLIKNFRFVSLNVDDYSSRSGIIDEEEEQAVEEEDDEDNADNGRSSSRNLPPGTLASFGIHSDPFRNKLRRVRKEQDDENSTFESDIDDDDQTSDQRSSHDILVTFYSGYLPMIGLSNIARNLTHVGTTEQDAICLKMMQQMGYQNCGSVHQVLVSHYYQYLLQNGDVANASILWNTDHVNQARIYTRLMRANVPLPQWT